jgi:hypothetical protein
MDKEEFHWVFGVMQGWFSAKLGSIISDGSQLSAQFSWATNSYIGYLQILFTNLKKGSLFSKQVL